MTTASDVVRESGLLESLFVESLADLIQRDEESGLGRWVFDPDVDGVVGFQVKEEFGWETVVVLYLEHEDFEVNVRYADGA